MADFRKLSLAVIGGTVVIAGGIIGSSALLSRSSFNLKSTTSHATEKTITVKGVAEKEIISDIGAFGVVVAWNAPDMVTGYAETARWRGLLDKKFEEIGIKQEFIETQSLNYNAVFKTITTKEGNKTNSTQVFSHYRFTYNFRIVSPEVKILESAPTRLCELIAKGMDISVSDVEFFIKNPEQYKLALVDAATNSAYQRAKIVAESCGSSLGPLLLARQGVIQITRPASNDTSDYGMYDTRTVKKVMRLVMTLEFSLEKK